MRELNLIESLFRREIDTAWVREFRDWNLFSRLNIERLNLEAELKGHEGCVNCLEWNRSGTLLASGSDDLKVNIWDPYKQKLLKSVNTKHRGNIFSVRFIPGTSDSLIASAAADCNIFVHDLNKNLYLHEIYAHSNRVKKLATCQSIPFLFWSCGEDGLVLQHDIRCSSNETTKLLLNYKGCSSGNNMEAKCLALNEVKTELIAVGNSDPYARVYDRRMIKLSSYSTRRSDNTQNESSSSKCLFEYSLINDEDLPIKFYTPGHLPNRVVEYRKRMKTLSVTHLTFSPVGNELLVNLGGEQLYLFDLARSTANSQFNFNSYKDLINVELTNEEGEVNNKKKKVKLSPKAEDLKSKANISFDQANYVEAIEFYNLAIEISPDSPILYGNRAASLLKRKWDGDIYMAMLDCYKALSIDKMHLKSHFRLIKCLTELKQMHEAKECMDVFVKQFPDYANSNACDILVNEIERLLAKESEKKNSSSSSSGSDSEENEFYQYLSKRSKTDEKTSDEDEINELDEETLTNKKKLLKMKKKYANSKENAINFSKRYCGHCNVSTDIKEACFLGKNFICAGSDDGSFFIWDKTTTNVVRVLRGDESIVNCIQPNPYDDILATSGIDPYVRLWRPQYNEEKMTDRDNERIVTDVKEAAINNQRQMNSHPFEFLLLNLAQNQDSQEDENQNVACRPS